MTDLDALLRQLPDDPRPVERINADLEAALDAALDDWLAHADGPSSWAHAYRAYLATSRFLRHHLEQQRLALEIHAWRIGHVLGLGAARCPVTIQLDLSRPLQLRETTLLWCRFTLDDAPWEGFDLRPLRSFTQPKHDPIGRALWRLATGSATGRLRQEHREVLSEVRRQPLGFAALAIEEAREIVAETAQVDALRLVIELLHDPILIDRRPDDGLSLLGRAQLYRARAHLELGALAAAAEALDRWKGLDASIRIFDEQRLLAAETKARLEMERGDLDAAGDRLARSVLKIAEGSAVSTERRVEIFTAIAEQHARCRRFEDAAGLLSTALTWIRANPDDCVASLHIEVVEHLATARWNALVDAIRPQVFDTDPLADSLFAIVEAHRQPFRDLRADLDRVAADVLQDGIGLDDALDLLNHRWWLARAWVIDDPHDAIKRLTAVAVGLAQHVASCFAYEIAYDLLFALRLAGWRLDQLVDAEPLARLVTIEPEIGPFVQAIIRGEKPSPPPEVGESVTPSDWTTDPVTVH